MYELIYNRNDWTQIFSPGDNICNYYLISTCGRIFSILAGKFLQTTIKENGYEAVSLYTNDGKRIQRKIHRLMMFSFCYIPDCENLQVNHKDGNKLNNVLYNLEWVTPKENINHAIVNGLRKSWSNENNPKSILNNNQVLDICSMCLNGYSNRQIMEKYNFVSEQMIYNIVYGRNWNDIISDDLVEKMKSIRHPEIISDLDKHKLCKYYQDNKKYETYHGSVKDYIEKGMKLCGILINPSTYNQAKRLYYKYQDKDITSQYIY